MALITAGSAAMGLAMLLSTGIAEGAVVIAPAAVGSVGSAGRGVVLKGAGLVGAAAASAETAGAAPVGGVITGVGAVVDVVTAGTAVGATVGAAVGVVTAGAFAGGCAGVVCACSSVMLPVNDAAVSAKTNNLGVLIKFS